ncbi:MAG TPA: helix-turn-helix domain-containing protein [Phycisphaerae bacterium]|nr:helix-turn-helix domain-containing protein [Phycisphaerae bacterium]
MRRKEVLTTGEVARICHVAPRTVSKWFDSGKLQGYRIPGSRDRRIPLNELIQFMRHHGMPLRELEGNTIRILIVDGDGASAAGVADDLARTERYELRTAANGFEAGMVAGSFRPHVILVDVLDEAVDAREMLRNVRGNSDLAATRIIAVTGSLTSGQAEALLRDGFDQVLRRPFDLNGLVGAVEEAADLIS